MSRVKWGFDGATDPPPVVRILPGGISGQAITFYGEILFVDLEFEIRTSCLCQDRILNADEWEIWGPIKGSLAP